MTPPGRELLFSGNIWKRWKHWQWDPRWRRSDVGNGVEQHCRGGVGDAGGTPRRNRTRAWARSTRLDAGYPGVVAPPPLGRRIAVRRLGPRHCSYCSFETVPTVAATVADRYEALKSCVSCIVSNFGYSQCSFKQFFSPANEFWMWIVSQSMQVLWSY